MSLETLRVQLLSDNATLPCRLSHQAAGYDLFRCLFIYRVLSSINPSIYYTLHVSVIRADLTFSAETTTIPARGRAVVRTDISIAIPDGTYGRVASRSGLAVKHGIDVGAGVVDADYRGPLGVVLFNHSNADFVISIGDRIAQLILETIVTPPIEAVAALNATPRGAGGFGSTGR